MKDTKIPSNKNFGIVFFIVFFSIAIYPLVKNSDMRVWSLVVSIIFLVLGLINSKLLTPLNKLWFKFGILLGRFFSPIIMGAIFFFVVTPTGLILRIFGKDILNLKKNSLNSYWIDCKEEKKNMKNQF